VILRVSLTPVSDERKPRLMNNLSDLTTAVADAFRETAKKVGAEARDALDPAEAERLRKTASAGHRIAAYFDGLTPRVADAEQRLKDEAAAKADRLRGLVAESRKESGLREVDPISETAPLGTQYRRIVAGNLLADIGVLGTDRVCGILTDSGAPCVLKEDHRPPRYDEDQPYHADAEQAARARRYLIHSDPDKTKRG
jgi:hypothetical protein